MIEAVLKRISQTDEATFGVIMINSQPIALTLERPWLNNEEDISCIPSGSYQCLPHNGAEWQNVWEVSGVSNRTGILIHSGNFASDTKGCVIVGCQYGPDSVILSKIALDELRKKLPKEFTLTIKGI